MTSPDAGLPGEQRNDEQGGVLSADLVDRLESAYANGKTLSTTEMYLLFMSARSTAAVRVELQAARDEAAAARRILDRAAEIACEMWHADTCASELSPGQGYPCSCSLTELRDLLAALSPDTETRDEECHCGDPGCDGRGQYKPGYVCPTCDGTRWIEDKNWEPDHRLARPKREPHNGLTPCGTCSFGDWTNDVMPKGTPAVAVPETRDKETRHG